MMLFACARLTKNTPPHRSLANPTNSLPHRPPSPPTDPLPLPLRLSLSFSDCSEMMLFPPGALHKSSTYAAELEQWTNYFPKDALRVIHTDVRRRGHAGRGQRGMHAGRVWGGGSAAFATPPRARRGDTAACTGVGATGGVRMGTRRHRSECSHPHSPPSAPSSSIPRLP